MKTLNMPTEFKAMGDLGEFDGYASVFDHVDLGNDRISKGAFKELSLTKDGMVRILNNHNPRDPIGKAHVEEDDHGLRFKGKLLLDVPSARTAYSLMKAGITDGMSIGYDILADGAENLKGGIRQLKALKLWEISTVVFGMNTLARIDNVKGADEINTIREFETFLRDVGGYSAGQAKALASSGYSALASERDATPEADHQRLYATIIDLKTPKSLFT